MLVRPAFFRSVRLLVLLCLLLGLPTLVSQAAPSASAADVDSTFQPELLMSSTISRFVAQPDGKVIVAGDFTSVNGVRRTALARLNANGTLDPSFAPVSIPPVYFGNNQTPAALALQADGKLLIGGDFNQVNGVSRRSLARLNADGTLDTSFASNPGPYSRIWSMAVQPDGKVIVVGQFNTFDNVARPGIARLNVDGSLDLTFIPDLQYSGIQTMALQADGKLLIGGSFSTNSMGRSALARLNADGSLDTSFAPALSQDRSVHHMALQANGQIVITGSFTSVDSVSRPGLARLNADGSLDPSFNPTFTGGNEALRLLVQPNGKVVLGSTAPGQPALVRLNPNGSLDPSFPPSVRRDSGFDFPPLRVDDLGLQADGKLLLSGSFTRVDQVRRTGIARLNLDDSLDSSFVPSLNTVGEAQFVASQTNGKVIVAGKFTSVGGVSRPGLARLNADGSLDASFDPGTGVNGQVRGLALQSDGKLVLGGFFTTVNGIRRDGIARLNTNGSLDASFNPELNPAGKVRALVLQPDDKILLGGDFMSINGTSREAVARLNADGSLDAGFSTMFRTFDNIRMFTRQADGKLLVVFNDFGDDALARLNADGSSDPSFTSMYLRTPGRLESVAVQPDGKILIGGSFQLLYDPIYRNLARLNANGSQDLSFEMNSSMDPSVKALLLQPDGKILAGSSGDYGPTGVWRFNSDGSRDPSFSIGADSINTIIPQADGKLIIGGRFETIGGVSRTGLARLHNPLAAPRLFLDPPTTTIGQGQIVELKLQLDTAGRVADTVDAYLTFDPAALEVVDAQGDPATSIMPNSAVVGSVTHNQVAAATGQIDFSASTYTSPYITGQATIATVRLRAKAPIAGTSVQLVRSGIRQSDLFFGGTSLQTALGDTTLAIMNEPIICGQIAVEQRGPSGTPRWMTPLFRMNGAFTTGGVTLYQPGTTTEVARLAATTDASGRFCASVQGVPLAVYDVRVKGANTLSNQRAGINLAEATTIDFGTLRVGDATGDDGVTGADVSYIIPAFFLHSGDPGFRPYADTNQDDEVSGADVSALIPNFLTSGPHPVTSATNAQSASPHTAAEAPAQIALTPALKQLPVGEIAALDIQLHLGTLPADTVDLQIQVDPQWLDLVDRSGQPATKLDLSQSAFSDVTYHVVDRASGTIHLSASRLRAAPVTGTVTLGTLYVRAKAAFASTAITLKTTGPGRTDVFFHGASRQPIATGSVLTTDALHRAYLPAAHN